MTIGITGPRRRAPWRGAVVVGMTAAIVLSICLILLGLMGDFLVDWLWFSTIGYLGVFWTTIVAEAEVFFAVFLATANILWVSGLLASRFARSPWTQRPADFEWKRTGRAVAFSYPSMGSGGKKTAQLWPGRLMRPSRTLP